MKYTVITRSSIDELVRTINTLLEDGWKCQGGMVVEPRNTWNLYHQTLILGDSK